MQWCHRKWWSRKLWEVSPSTEITIKLVKKNYQNHNQLYENSGTCLDTSSNQESAWWTERLNFTREPGTWTRYHSLALCPTTTVEVAACITRVAGWNKVGNKDLILQKSGVVCFSFLRNQRRQLSPLNWRGFPGSIYQKI